MKRITLILTVLVAGLILVFTSCEESFLEPGTNESILPENFKVDIPDALTQSGPHFKSTAVDTLNGNEIYEHLTNFIAVGEGASEIVQDIMLAIAIYGINQPMSLTFTGDDDKRDKNLVVVEESYFEGTTWDYQLTITDAGSEGNEDGGNAIQVFWSTQPIEGIAILKPYNIDRKSTPEPNDAIFRIDYSERQYMDYEAHMIVTIAGLPVANPLTDPYGISALKMFVGKDGDVIDVYGNTNHPNAKFFSQESGFNWAFVASGDDYKEIGVAEVGLPPSNLDETSRTSLLDYYSIKNVFTREIYSVWPWIDETTVNSYLHNTEAPGFFSENGFIQGGTSPGEDWDPLALRIEDLVPYNPKEISNLTLSFK